MGDYMAVEARPPMAALLVVATVDSFAGLLLSFHSSCAICCCLQSKLQNAVSPLPYLMTKNITKYTIFKL